MRFIAVDWSGAADRGSQRRKIWLAEARDGQLTRLESGRDRDEVCAELADVIEASAEVVIGLDFAFSYPAWFCREQGATDGETTWRVSKTLGESWLRMQDGPFWDGTKQRRPRAFVFNSDLEFRETDREIKALKLRGVSPTSVFKLVGASQVGRGSVRGQPYLLKLREAGARVWPFDEPRLPLVVEIYPRSLTGEVVKSNSNSRTSYLERRNLKLSPKFRMDMEQSDDAFDAGVSAMVMSYHAQELGNLKRVTDTPKSLEGEIWRP